MQAEKLKRGELALKIDRGEVVSVDMDAAEFEELRQGPRGAIAPYSCWPAGLGMLATAECQAIESALTDPMTAISSASISTPATITIRMDWSIVSLHCAPAASNIAGR